MAKPTPFWTWRTVVACVYSRSAVLGLQMLWCPVDHEVGHRSPASSHRNVSSSTRTCGRLSANSVSGSWHGWRARRSPMTWATAGTCQRPRATQLARLAGRSPGAKW